MDWVQHRDAVAPGLVLPAVRSEPDDHLGDCEAQETAKGKEQSVLHLFQTTAVVKVNFDWLHTGLRCNVTFISVRQLLLL
jgi:hypothetical protein